MASISMNITPAQGATSTHVTNGEKFIVLDSTGKLVTVGINQILNRVDEGIIDRIDDPILDIVDDKIDDMINEHLENIDTTGNLKWNEVYD